MGQEFLGDSRDTPPPSLHSLLRVQGLARAMPGESAGPHLPGPGGPSAACLARPVLLQVSPYVHLLSPASPGGGGCPGPVRRQGPKESWDHPGATSCSLQRVEQGQHLPWSPFFPLSSVGLGHLKCPCIFSGFCFHPPSAWDPEPHSPFILSILWGQPGVTEVTLIHFSSI